MPRITTCANLTVTMKYKVHLNIIEQAIEFKHYYDKQTLNRYKEHKVKQIKVQEQ